MMDVRLTDYHPPLSNLREEVLAGFAQPQKSLSPKWFYDEAGSRLFDAITRLPEYYPTRTELGIMRQYVGEMAEEIGAGSAMIEFGSGSSTKVRILLDHLMNPAAYVPVDISKEHLRQSAQELACDYPAVSVLPVCADFTQPFKAPLDDVESANTLVYFPGSTIGNFEPEAARQLLSVMRMTIEDDGGVLIGVDLKKDHDTLELAYNDAAGVTAQFNKNLLVRLNRELQSDFDLDRFEHNALYNEYAGRIEMHLISRVEQKIHIGDEIIHFNANESILTECSYKYDVEQFALLAMEQGFEVKALWTDSQRYFGIYYLVPSAD